MEILAKIEAERLELYHLAQAFSVSDATRIRRQDEADRAVVTITRNGKVFTGKALFGEGGDGKAGKNASAGLAFARAAEMAGGVIPPYGTLTGVRPVKVALRYVNDEKEEAVRLLTSRFLVAPDKASLLYDLAEIEKREAKRDEVMLYVSVPFCPTRCRYCSFISSAAPKHLALIPAYLELLKRDLALTGEALSRQGRKISAVYVGGGTPGVLTERQLKELTDSIEKNFGKGIPEYTVELGRPDTVTKEKLAVLAAAGVDRVCINPQTTRNDVLRQNGRAHTAQDFFRAMEEARAFPFRAINCDLIAGLDGDGAEGFLASVKDVLSLQPENVTIHALCRKKAAADQTDRVEGFPGLAPAMEKAHKLCMEAGLFPYYLYRQKMAVAGLENLGFAKAGTLSRYNLCMMEDLCHVAACGAGAIGKVIHPSGGKIRRFPRQKYPFEYLAEPERIPALIDAFSNALEERA